MKSVPIHISTLTHVRSWHDCLWTGPSRRVRAVWSSKSAFRDVDPELRRLPSSRSEPNPQANRVQNPTIQHTERTQTTAGHLHDELQSGTTLSTPNHRWLQRYKRLQLNHVHIFGHFFPTVHTKNTTI